MLALQNGNFSSRCVGVGGVESTCFLTLVDIVVIKFQMKRVKNEYCSNLQKSEDLKDRGSYPAKHCHTVNS